MKTKFDRAVAIEVARELQPLLTPVCERMAIAGSVRRGKQEVSDLELLIIPKTDSRPDGLFDRKDVDLASEALDGLLAIGTLAKRPNVNGHTAWGALNKLGLHPRTGLGVDIFTTDLDGWFRSLVIRTGSRDFNVRLIQALAKQGFSLHAYGKSLTDRGGYLVKVESEEHLFELAKIPYLQPKDRKA